MSDFATLTAKIADIVQDTSITDVPGRINDCVSMIAGGIRLENGQVSPPLPDLYEISTVDTTVNAYVALPSTYQRDLAVVADSSGDIITPPTGGNYQAFQLFLKCVSGVGLTETGSVYAVAQKGTRLYYQGIPSVAKTLTVHFYRKPVDMIETTDTPDGIPTHLSDRLIKHYICADIYGEMIEAGEDSANMGRNYHLSLFYTAMTDLVDYIGIDSKPVYYGGGTSVTSDAGVCDNQ